MKFLVHIPFLLLVPFFVGLAVAEAPNLLFIIVDDMSADSLGCFGATLPDTSPNIDHFAAEGTRFRHAHEEAQRE